MAVKTKEEESTFPHLFFFRFIYKGPTKKQKPSLPSITQPSRFIYQESTPNEKEIGECPFTG